MKKEKVLFELYVQELISRGLLDAELAKTGTYIFKDEEVDGNELNNAERDAYNRYNQQYRWLYGEVTDEDWETFRELCWKEGL